MKNNKIRKSARVTLGATAAMTTAIMMTGCTATTGTQSTTNETPAESDTNPSSSTGTSTQQAAKEARMFDNVRADYIQICKDIETNARLTNDNCLESSSETAKWYYMPLYHNNTIEIPSIGEEVGPQAVENIPDDKTKTELGESTEKNDYEFFAQAAQGYGFNDEDNALDADYVEICIDAEGNRVDDSQCGVGEMPQGEQSSGGGGSHSSLIWLPLFMNGNTYVPPVGERVNTSNAISDRSQLQGNKIQKAPSKGVSSAYSPNGKTAKAGEAGARGNGKGSVSRGGTGSSGKAGG